MQRANAIPDEPQVMTVEEAARILGIGRGLAYRLASTGEIPTLQLGRRRVVPRAAIDQLLHEALRDREGG